MPFKRLLPPSITSRGPTEYHKNPSTSVQKNRRIFSVHLIKDLEPPHHPRFLFDCPTSGGGDNLGHFNYMFPHFFQIQLSFNSSFHRNISSHQRNLAASASRSRRVHAVPNGNPSTVFWCGKSMRIRPYKGTSQGKQGFKPRQ